MHVSEDLLQPPGVGDPLFQELSLFLGDADGDRLAFHLSRPFVVRTVQLGRIRLATTTGFAARDEPPQDGAAPEWAKLGQGCLQGPESILVSCRHGLQCRILLDCQYVYW